MANPQLLTTRRNYNRWVANQTLEDFALRFTGKNARRWSSARVSNTALGAISFLALEAIGAAITLVYGVHAALLATMVVSAIIFLTAIPISYYAARYGVDIDLLSRGAGFGYIGSTVTSLIYASFTFIFMALEAAIMASAMDILFSVPLWLGYLISALIVIPLVTHGITLISRFQLWTQPLWFLLQLAPFVFILWQETQAISDWINFESPVAPSEGNGVSLIYFGAASAVIFSLIAQIGEQVDFLRFLPEPKPDQRLRWWTALIIGGPGWILMGAIKIMAGSFLVVLALSHGLGYDEAGDPTHMYAVAFSYLTESPLAVMALTGIFVVLCQVKINVTNAYAGSIAWSNFFSRLTHSHPGRVVWLFFNVMIAILVMALGVYESLEHILGIYSNVAVAWVGALVADLVINKPLGLSPKHIEFKRAYLYDINPVGFGAMVLASLCGILSFTGIWGETAQALSSFISLFTAFFLAPVIALITGGKYYLAREIIPLSPATEQLTCSVCENEFDREDIAVCPAYNGHICSLCCTLESRCHDQCKENARFSDQIAATLTTLLPDRLVHRLNPRILQFSGLLTIIGGIVGLLFWLVYMQAPSDNSMQALLGSSLLQVYVLLMIIVGVLIWLFVLANESRELALDEATKQTDLLSQEIAAHEETDRALQQAKELAEAANLAKSRYLGGISHELRSPLNSVLGYAQLLEKSDGLSDKQQRQISLIRSSGEYLADLIEGLLDLSRIEAGRLEIRRDEVNLKRLLNDLAEMFRLQSLAKGITFTYDALAYLPDMVRTDEKHLRQILTNLLSNAVKYTETGGVTLSVKYRSQVAEFTVKDTGPGISAEEHKKIFQPFERIRKPGHPQQPGTGLGLTISQLLADIMGGEITLKSAPGSGSTFRLTMMLSSIERKVHLADKPAAPAQKIIGYEGDKRVVLTVDDEPSHRGLISETLSPLGFTVLEASGADECEAVLGEARVDLLLLDISMPGRNGWTLLQKLRNDGFSAPVIMVSADAEDRVSAEGNGAFSEPGRRLNDDYLIKPLKDQVLLDKIARQLDLSWIYEGSPEDAPEQATVAPMSDARLREFMSFSQLGYVAGLEALTEACEQEQLDPEFVRELKRCITSFRFADVHAMCAARLDAQSPKSQDNIDEHSIGSEKP